MHITISIQAPPGFVDEDILNLDVGSDMTLADLKAVISSDTNIQTNVQAFRFNGQQLSDDSNTLENVGIKEGDMVSMLVRHPQAGSRTRPSQPMGTSRGGRGRGTPTRGQGAQQPRDDAEIIRLQALGDPQVLEQLRHHRSDLANAVQDPQQFRQIYDSLRRQQDEAEREKREAVEALNADPLNVEAQAKIEEMIREAAVMENLQNAMHYTPEAFGRVHMLYIDVEVNGNKVKAFVDSGAQATIMSPSCAEKCGIMRLIDKRFAGIARGVGTAKILGRVHSAQIKIGNLYLPCSFTVMEGKDVDLLLGLDMLKRHQACIDLQKERLMIRDQEVPFLGEADIPKNEETLMDEPTVEGPAGMQVGGRSGAITQAGAAGAGASNFQGQGHAVEGTSIQRTGQEPATASFSPADIAQLVSMGFGREEVVRALEIAGGNVEVAAGLLTGML